MKLDSFILLTMTAGRKQRKTEKNREIVPVALPQFPVVEQESAITELENQVNQGKELEVNTLPQNSFPKYYVRRKNKSLLSFLQLKS